MTTFVFMIPNTIHWKPPQIHIVMNSAVRCPSFLFILSAFFSNWCVSKCFNVFWCVLMCFVVFCCVLLCICVTMFCVWAHKETEGRPLQTWWLYSSYLRNTSAYHHHHSTTCLYKSFTVKPLYKRMVVKLLKLSASPFWPFWKSSRQIEGGWKDPQDW